MIAATIYKQAVQQELTELIIKLNHHRSELLCNITQPVTMAQLNTLAKLNDDINALNKRLADYL